MVLRTAESKFEYTLENHLTNLKRFLGLEKEKTQTIQTVIAPGVVLTCLLFGNLSFHRCNWRRTLL